ncbi:MAG: serine hydrolase domain-containing protein [Anaerolineales bacterium]
MIRPLFRVAWVSTLLNFLSNCVVAAGVTQAGDREDVLQDALVQGIAMGIPGLSVAIGTDDGLAWTGTAGYSDLLEKVPVKTCDRFCVGSITKTFVARVILQLAKEGKLDLTRTAADYLDLEIVREVPNSDKATLRQLLNHQSGIPDWESQEMWIRVGRGDQMDLGKVWDKTETLEYVRSEHLPAVHEPGQQYRYSNTNYTILGLIIEAITGNDAATEIRQRILQPLHLEETFFESFEDVPGGYVHHYHYATPHFVDLAGVHREFSEIRPYLVESTAANFSPEWTAGGMVSSARDLVRWAQAIRNGELLDPTVQKEIFTHYPPQEFSSSKEEYMLGILRIKDYYNDRAVIGHGGGTLGFTAKMYWFEETDIVVVLLTNVGEMHSGMNPSPVGMFYREVLLPAVLQFLDR